MVETDLIDRYEMETTVNSADIANNVYPTKVNASFQSDTLGVCFGGVFDAGSEIQDMASQIEFSTDTVTDMGVVLPETDENSCSGGWGTP